MPQEDHENCQCNWSYLPETADLLTARMLDAKGKDVPYHVSDVSNRHGVDLWENICGV